MQRLKFICIEDDVEFSEKLKQIVIQYFHYTNFLVTVDVYHNIPQSLDLDKVSGCFFDIQIGNCNIIEYLKDIKKKNYKIPVILISNYDNYIFQTVHLQIFDFIRKSNFDEEIISTLNHLREHLNYKSESIHIPYNGNIYHIFINDIIYIETLSHRIIIHCMQGKDFDIWKSYSKVFNKEYESLVRTHKSYVININYCDRIDKYKTYLKDTNIKIPISQRNYKKVEEKFIDMSRVFR